MYCFVDNCLLFCPFSFGHCIVGHSRIYDFWLPLGIFWLPLGIFWLPLGIFWLLLGIFWLPLGIFWLPLGIFWLPMGIFWLPLGIFWLPLWCLQIFLLFQATIAWKNTTIMSLPQITTNMVLTKMSSILNIRNVLK